MQCSVEPPPCSGIESCISGRRLRINSRRGVSIAFDTRDLAIIPGEPEGATDPAAVGAMLDMGDLGGTAMLHMPLEAAGWTAKRKAKTGLAYRYRGAGDTRCRAKLGVGRLRIRCRQPAGSLAAPLVGPVGVRVSIGDALVYCLQFDRESASGGGANSGARWRAREAVAPLQCPVISPVSP
jgi:hypothetical protein